LDFPDGDVGLDLEPPDGDVYYAVSDVTLERGGNYLLWVEGAAALGARLDGAVAISRVPYPLESPRAQTTPVRLAPGMHRVLVRWSRAEGNRFRIALVREDGGVSDLSSAAPAELSGARAAASCDLGQVCVAPPAWTDRADLRASAAAMLEVPRRRWRSGCWRAPRWRRPDVSRPAVERRGASASGAPLCCAPGCCSVPDRIGQGPRWPTWGGGAQSPAHPRPPDRGGLGARLRALRDAVRIS
jgi:hypothetical protein